MGGKRHKAEAEPVAPPVHDDAGEGPGFDALDMALGFGIAATIFAQAYVVAAVLGCIFVTQKAMRGGAGVGTLAAQLRPLLSAGAELATRLLPGGGDDADLAGGGGGNDAGSEGDKDASSAEVGAGAMGETDTPALAGAGAGAGAEVGKVVTSEPAQAAPADPLLTLLAEAPHLLMIGHTRGGKTTLLHALATKIAASGARVIVADPDAAPGQWPGCQVVGGGDDFLAIGRQLMRVDAEVQRRRGLRAKGQRRFAPLYLVCDEVQDTIAEVDDALDLIETVARRGAKLNVHLALGVQDKQVQTLGLAGKGDLRRNFLVADVYYDRQAGRRVARLQDGGAQRTVPIPQLPDPEQLIVTQAAAPAQKSQDRAAGTAVPAAPSTSTPAPAPAAPATAAPADDLLAALLQSAAIATTPTSAPAAHPVNDGNSRSAQPDALNAVPERSAANVPALADDQRSADSEVRSAETAAAPSRSAELPRSAETAPSVSADDVGQAMLRLMEILSSGGGDPSRIAQLLARLRQLGPGYDELVRLTGALVLRGEGKTKQEAIETAFACTKGAGAAWRRAAALYDAVTGR